MTIQMNSSNEEWEKHRQALIKETKAGGELADKCYLCKLPLCQRSDYVRCSHCGMNWPIGSDYARHPSFAWARKTSIEVTAQ